MGKMADLKRRLSAPEVEGPLGRQGIVQALRLGQCRSVPHAGAWLPEHGQAGPHAGRQNRPPHVPEHGSGPLKRCTVCSGRRKRLPHMVPMSIRIQSGLQLRKCASGR